MADSIFGSLLNMIDPRDTRAISIAVGEPEQSVIRGIRSCIASVMGNLCSKAGDPGALRKSLDLVPAGLHEAGWSDFVEAATDPNTPATGIGSRMMSSFFGSSENSVLNAIGRHTGMRSGVVQNLMSLCVPLVLGFINRKVRDDGLSMSSLGNMLERESGAIRNGMPHEIAELFWPRAAAATATASPVVVQEIHRQRSTNWALPLALGALVLGLGWWFAQRRPAVIEHSRSTVNEPTGTASRAREAPTPAPIPESKPATAPEPAKTAAIDEVDLKYRTGSSVLTPASQDRLDQLAKQAVANPDAKLNVSGYTDDVGDAGRNMKLSQMRADNAMASLVHKGIAKDRVTAKGYGEADPVASNDTNQGRAANRRVVITIE